MNKESYAEQGLPVAASGIQVWGHSDPTFSRGAGSQWWTARRPSSSSRGPSYAPTRVVSKHLSVLCTAASSVAMEYNPGGAKPRGLLFLLRSSKSLEIGGSTEV